MQNVGSGWWEARNSHGQVGLVPQSYFEVLELLSVQSLSAINGIALIS